MFSDVREASSVASEDECPRGTRKWLLSSVEDSPRRTGKRRGARGTWQEGRPGGPGAEEQVPVQGPQGAARGLRGKPEPG